MPGIRQFNGVQMRMAIKEIESLKKNIGDGYIARAALAYLKAAIDLHSFCVE